MRYSPKNHKWAVIQSGYCVFGTGRTREAAIANSLENLDKTEYQTVDQVEADLKKRFEVVDGSLYLTEDPQEIRQYVENQ